jgi:hypothetical protein
VESNPHANPFSLGKAVGETELISGATMKTADRSARERWGA